LCRHPHYYKDRYKNSTKPWLEKHPGYQQNYRATHPKAVKKNRHMQKKRSQQAAKTKIDIQDMTLIQTLVSTGDRASLNEVDIQDMISVYLTLFTGLTSCLRRVDKQDMIDISLHSIYNRGRFLLQRYAVS
jgi:hypothetical protein